MSRSCEFASIATIALLVPLLQPLGCQHEGDHPAAPPATTVSAVGAASALDGSTVAAAPTKRVIVFVWDGLRPDSITEQDTPRLAELARTGANFSDHHATYPTFTMVNSGSLATGGSLGTNGFYGNWVWQPAAPKHSPSGAALLSDAGAPVRYDAPVFTEDYSVVRDLDDFYGGDLLLAGSLFEIAREHGLTTAAIGKSGSAYLQDRHKRGFVLDEKAVWPASLVNDLKTAGFRVPKATSNAYPPGQVTVDAASNGDPTAIPPSKKLADGQSTDPTDASGGTASLDNAYLMDAYAGYILPTKKPELTVIWLRNPDTAQHWYGPGTANVRQSLRDVDGLLGKLLDKLSALGWRDFTDVIIASDHGHSTVSGRLESFPLRAIVPGKAPGEGGTVGGKDPSGYSVSGDVRLADLFTRIGKFRAFDGIGCLYDPVLSGIASDGKPLYPVHTDDAHGTVCGTDPKTGKGSLKYNTPPYRVPATLPADALIVAVNGGSDYVYAPSHDAALVQRAVKFLQSREEVGPLFVASRYPAITGTLPMALIGIENNDPRRIPDIVVGYDYDENATVAGMRGIEYEGAQNYRGMHGSFSPMDVHNTLVALGPDFRTGWVDTLPTANVDVAPTVARILDLPLGKTDGRILSEALTSGGAATSDYEFETPAPVTSPEATGLRVLLPTDTDGSRVDRTKTKYHVVLKTRKVVREGRSYTYFDWAKGVRE
jgi:arylsulfatase A-like enzyme